MSKAAAFVPERRLMASIYEELAREELALLRAYTPAHGDYAVRLDANEAPALLSPDSQAKLRALAMTADFARYPDASQVELRRALAARSGVAASEIAVGTGSDELIALLMTAFCRPLGKHPTATVLTTTPSFVMYRMSAQARGLRAVEVPLDTAWDVPLEAMLRAIEMTEPSLIFIASPNNPTGTCASTGRLRTIVQAAPKALVIVDEAYVDYADGNARALYDEFENVALLRTLSKIGFAGLRIGWLVAKPECVDLLDRVRLPYNLPTLSQQLAVLAVTELEADIARVTTEVRAERERLQTALAELPALEVTPSQANFLWVKTARPALDVYQGLKDRGILVRTFHERGGRLANQLRITVGTPRENDLLLQALAEVS